MYKLCKTGVEGGQIVADFGITLSISSSCHFKLLIREFLPGVDFVEGRLLQQLESRGKAGPENEYVCENREKEEEN